MATDHDGPTGTRERDTAPAGADAAPTPTAAPAVTVEVVPLDTLTPLTDNPRTHTSRGIDFLKASLGRVGAARSGVIDEARTILAGNGMQDAATQVGYREAVVVTTDGTRPVFVRCRPPAQSRPTPVVLDDGDSADLASQRELFGVLRAIDVDVKRLVRDLYLWQRQDRALLIKERRAHVYEMQAKAGRPLFRVLITGFERYANRLKAQGCPVPHRVDDAVYALLNGLEDSVNAITDRMEGDPPSSDDRTADRYAAERRRLPRSSGVHTRIAPGARLPAIQQRYMPGVYRIVHRRILAALEAYSGSPLTYGGRRIVNMFASDGAVASSADRLTAAFVQLVYPLWGASTTATSASGKPGRGPKASLDNAAIGALARATHSNSRPVFDSSIMLLLSIRSRPIALAVATWMVKGASWPLIQITTTRPARTRVTRRLLEQTSPPRRRPTPPSRSRSCPLTR